MERIQMTVRIPDELKAEIQRKADEEGQSLNAEIILLLRRGLEAE